MRRDDWHAYLETAPLTANQLGRIMAEWERLGLADDEDRAQRLALTAALLGLGELGSTRALVQGDAGRLLRILRSVGGRGELDALLPAPDQATAPRCTLADLAHAIAAALDLVQSPRRVFPDFAEPSR